MENRVLSLNQILRVGICFGVAYITSNLIKVEELESLTRGGLYLFIALSLFLVRGPSDYHDHYVPQVYKSRIPKMINLFVYGLACGLLNSFVVWIVIAVVAWLALFNFAFPIPKQVNAGFVIGLYLAGFYLMIFSVERTNKLQDALCGYVYKNTNYFKARMKKDEFLPYPDFGKIKELDLVPSALYYLGYIFDILKPVVIRVAIFLYNTCKLSWLYQIIIFFVWLFELIQHIYIGSKYYIYVAGSYSLRLVLFLTAWALFFFGLGKSCYSLYGLCRGDAKGAIEGLVITLLTLLLFTAIRMLIKTEIPLREEDRLIDP